MEVDYIISALNIAIYNCDTKIRSLINQHETNKKEIRKLTKEKNMYNSFISRIQKHNYDSRNNTSISSDDSIE